MMKKILLSLSVFALASAAAWGLSPTASLAQTTTAISSLQAGDLIRGQNFSAVYYYGADGFRYVFPNDKTYFTWYSNFDSVKWLTDADLGKIQIGGNVTYKPGVKMIKINSDPKTYAIGEGGALRWVSTESAAIALYGSDWNKKIDDVPDAFFSNYSRGEDIEVASDFNPANETASATTINHDKELQYAALILIQNNAYSFPTLTIKTGRAIRFENKDATKHTATADDLSWGTGTLNQGDTFSRYFNTPGTYTYFCSYHTNEQGTIVVE